MPSFVNPDHIVVVVTTTDFRYNKNSYKTGKIRYTVVELRTTNWREINSYARHNQPQEAFNSFNKKVFDAKNLCQTNIAKFKGDKRRNQIFNKKKTIFTGKTAFHQPTKIKKLYAKQKCNKKKTIKNV